MSDQKSSNFLGLNFIREETHTDIINKQKLLTRIWKGLEVYAFFEVQILIIHNAKYLYLNKKDEIN